MRPIGLFANCLAHAEGTGGPTELQRAFELIEALDGVSHRPPPVFVDVQLPQVLALEEMCQVRRLALPIA
eukprot:7200825-Alexandrium_andersonii.AAC.1